MWRWLEGRAGGCRAAREALDYALESSEILQWEEWLDSAPVKVRTHVAICPKCRRGAEETFASRSLLRSAIMPTRDPGAAFTAGVMRAVAVRERAQRVVSDAWYFLPRMAARFAWVCAILLVLVSTWAYERRPALQAGGTTTDAFLDPAPQPTTQDDVLLTLAESTP